MMREKMMNKVIRKYGFEAKETIEFCSLCEDENVTDIFIAGIYFDLMGW